MSKGSIPTDNKKQLAPMVESDQNQRLKAASTKSPKQIMPTALSPNWVKPLPKFTAKRDYTQPCPFGFQYSPQQQGG